MPLANCAYQMSITRVPFCEWEGPADTVCYTSRDRSQIRMTCLGIARLTLAVYLCGMAAFAQPQAEQTPAPQAPSGQAAQPNAAPQQPPPPTARPPKPQFFGGTVTQLDANHITISRTPPGKATERRTFTITAKTKISKAVRLRSHVTVRYQHSPDGDIALEVRIRPLMRTPRAS